MNSNVPLWVADNIDYGADMIASACSFAVAKVIDAGLYPGHALMDSSVTVADATAPTTTYTDTMDNVYDDSYDVSNYAGEDVYDMLGELQSNPNGTAPAAGDHARRGHLHGHPDAGQPEPADHGLLHTRRLEARPQHGQGPGAGLWRNGHPRAGHRSRCPPTWPPTGQSHRLRLVGLRHNGDSSDRRTTGAWPRARTRRWSRARRRSRLADAGRSVGRRRIVAGQ